MQKRDIRAGLAASVVVVVDERKLALGQVPGVVLFLLQLLGCLAAIVKVVVRLVCVILPRLLLLTVLALLMAGHELLDAHRLALGHPFRLPVRVEFVLVHFAATVALVKIHDGGRRRASRWPQALLLRFGNGHRVGMDVWHLNLPAIRRVLLLLQRFSGALQELLLNRFDSAVARDNLVQLFLLLFQLLILNLTNPGRLLVIYDLEAIGKFTISNLLPCKYILHIIAHFVQLLGFKVHCGGVLCVAYLLMPLARQGKHFR